MAEIKGLSSLSRIFGGVGRATQLRSAPKATGRQGTRVEKADINRRPLTTGPLPSPDEQTDDGVPSVRPQTREERIREHQIAARKYDERRWRLYVASRDARLKACCQSYPGAQRFVRVLSKLSDDTGPDAPTVIGYRDVDVDLAGIAAQCTLDTIKDDSARFLLFEQAARFVDAVARRQGLNHDDYSPLFEVPPTSTLDELKTYLALR